MSSFQGEPDTSLALDVNELGDQDFDYALLYVGIGVAVVVLWLIIRAFAGRDHRWATSLYDRLAPQAYALRVWLSNAPITVIYCSCWVATTVLVQGSPNQLVEALTRYNSTNILSVVAAPIRSLFVSALLVADDGTGLLVFLFLYAFIVARLEHRLGGPRTVFVWVSAHAGASIIIVLIEVLGIKIGQFTDSIAVTADIGVSYVLVGSLGAYGLLVSQRWRWWYWAGLAVIVLVPLIVLHTIWDLGHFLATVLGTLAGWIALKIGPLRPQIRWRELTSQELEPLARGVPLKQRESQPKSPLLP